MPVELQLYAAITEIIAYLKESGYTARIEKLLYRYNKTHDSFGDYHR